MKINSIRFALAAFSAAICCLTSVANVDAQTVIGQDDFDGGAGEVFTSRAFSPDLSASDGQFNDPANGDVFGIVGNRASFAIGDESADAFPADTLGFANSTKTDLFLGFNDTVNDANLDPNGQVSVTWTFNTAGAIGLGLAFDVAGMGDFEGTANSSGNPANADSFSITAAFDGGTAQEVVFGTGDDEGMLTYTLESGTTVDLNDPFVIGTPGGDGTVVNATVINNIFQRLSFDIPGAGDELTLTLTTRFDGGSEALGVDNLELTSGGGVDPIRGDFDGDNDVDIDDLDRYIGNLGAAATGELAQLDLDGSGTVDVADFTEHYSQLVETANGTDGTLQGDTDLSGDVDIFTDGFAFLGNIGNSVSSWADGDFTADGQVDIFNDGFALLNNIGQNNGGVAGAPATSAVPEPGSVSLLALAFAGLAVRRKRS